MAVPGEEGCSNATILKLLECPVCFEPCQPPINMCVRSHIVCSKCSGHLKNCAMCRQPMAPERCWFAEQVSSKVMLPCENASHGCKELFNAKDLEAHHSDCRFRIYKCYMNIRIENGRRLMCYWSGRFSELLKHVNAVHPNNKSTNALPKYCANVDANFEGKTICSNTTLVEADAQHFWCVVLNYPESKEVEFVVLHIGTKETASKYKYSFVIQHDNDSSNKLTYTNEYMTTLLKDCKDKTFKLSGYLLKMYAKNDGKLTYKLTISKKKQPK